MIELISSKKMVGVTIVLIVVCLFIIILEGFLADDDGKPPLTEIERPLIPARKFINDKGEEANHTKSEDNLKLTKPENCWLNEQFVVTKACSKCSQFEIKSQHLSACASTGFKEEVKCSDSGLAFRPCDVNSTVWTFWKFELWMILLSLVSYAFTHYRENILQSRMLDKINKQIASGV